MKNTKNFYIAIAITIAIGMVVLNVTASGNIETLLPSRLAVIIVNVVAMCVVGGLLLFSLESPIKIDTNDEMMFIVKRHITGKSGKTYVTIHSYADKDETKLAETHIEGDSNMIAEIVKLLRLNHMEIEE